MLEGILEAIISSIILAFLAELWNKRDALLQSFKPRSSQQLLPPPAETNLPETTDVTGEELYTAPPPVPEATEMSPPPEAAEAHPKRISKGEIVRMFLRLGVAALMGFIIGGLVSGIMEAEGHGDIALGSTTSLWLIFVPTLVVWAFLYYFGPLKSKTT